MEKHYHTSVIINGEKVLPSDTFNLGVNEYLLLDISSGEDVFLHIVCSAGEILGKEFQISLQDFESKNPEELITLLS